MSTLCPQCGKPRAPDAALCPTCLLKRGLEPNTLPPSEIPDPGTSKSRSWTPPAPADLAPLFPELEILDFLGRGGMGAVYKASQKALNRLVALKILPPEIGRDGGGPAFTARFTREAQAMARLNHPHIVAIHDFGQRTPTQDSGLKTQDPLFFFLMEFVDGLSLRQLLSAGKLAPAEALAIVPQICEALQYAHNAGIVHRDIKPENILLDKTGQVKIADFGLAKLIGSTEISNLKFAPSETSPSPLTQVGHIMGTPNYMAPEQTQNPDAVDHRADIYSLGVVFYQMLTGELPQGAFAPPSKKVLIDVRLDEVVLRALEREPEKRYQQASEVKTEVETIATTPAGATKTGPRDTSMEVSLAAPAVREHPPLPIATSVRPRFSRVAIVGAAWVACFLAMMPLWLWHEFKTHEFETFGPFGSPLGALVFFVFELPAFTAPFGATLLGLISLTQIRHSAAGLYGVGLALFDVLFFPLLILDAVTVLPLWLAWPPQPDSQTIFWVIAIPLVCMLLDWWLIWMTWRAVVGPASGGRRGEKNPLMVGAAIGGAVLGVVVVSMLIYFYVSFYSEYQQHHLGISSVSPAARGQTPVEIATGVSATLSSGITVQLLGVSANPSDESAWWKPDGSALPVRPYSHLGAFSVPSKGQVAREFAVHLDHLPADPIGTDWRFDPSASSTGGASPVERGESLMNLRAMTVAVPAKQPTINIHFGVAAGPWQSIGEFNGIGGQSIGQGQMGVVFAPPVEKDGKTAITVSHSITDQEVRVVAVDKQGGEHTGGSQGGSTGSLHQITVTFTDLPLSEIHSYRFEYRPYEWVIFENVALNPSFSPAAATGTLVPGADGSKWQVNAEVDEADITKVEVGQDVRLTFDAFPGRVFKGKVGQIADQPTKAPNVVLYEVIVQGFDSDPRFKQGMTANVLFVVTAPPATQPAAHPSSPKSFDPYRVARLGSRQKTKSEAALQEAKAALAVQVELFKTMRITASELQAQKGKVDLLDSELERFAAAWQKFELVIERYKAGAVSSAEWEKEEQLVQNAEVRLRIMQLSIQVLPGAAAFGPVIERIVPANNLPPYAWFDIDTGRPVITLSGDDPDAADFAAGMEPGGEELSTAEETGFGAVPLKASQWDTITPAQLVGTLKSATADALPCQPPLPATYAFTTRADHVGLLQILGTSTKPNGIRIRYKLLEPTTTQPGSTPAASTSQSAAQLKIQATEEKLWQIDVERLKLKSELAIAEAELLEVSKPLGPTHPRVLAIKRTIDQLKERLAITDQTTGAEFPQANEGRDRAAAATQPVVPTSAPAASATASPIGEPREKLLLGTWKARAQEGIAPFQIEFLGNGRALGGPGGVAAPPSAAATYRVDGDTIKFHPDNPKTSDFTLSVIKLTPQALVTSVKETGLVLTLDRVVDGATQPAAAAEPITAGVARAAREGGATGADAAAPATHSTTAPASQPAPQSAARLKLEAAEESLKQAEAMQKLGRISPPEYRHAKLARDIVAAELANDPTQVALVKYHLAEDELRSVQAQVANGRATPSELQKATLARDRAAATTRPSTTATAPRAASETQKSEAK